MLPKTDEVSIPVHAMLLAAQDNPEPTCEQFVHELQKIATSAFWIVDTRSRIAIQKSAGKALGAQTRAKDERLLRIHWILDTVFRTQTQKDAGKILLAELTKCSVRQHKNTPPA